MKEKGWIGIAAVLAAGAVYSLYASFQPVYTYSLLDPRYDAHQYAKIYNYFSGITANYHVSFPFNTRILMPWLAVQLPFRDLTADFIWLNGFFIVATVGLLTWVWLQLGIRPFWVVIALFWILFHWKGLVRMYLPDPVTADVGGYFWLTLLLAFLFLSIEEKSKWTNFFKAFGLIVTVVLGTLQKESFIAVIGVTALWGGLSTWLVRTPTTARTLGTLPRLVSAPTKVLASLLKTDAFSMIKKELWVLIAAFLLALSAHYLVSSFFSSPTSDWRNNSLISVLRGIKRYAEQPGLFLRVPVSWFLAFGTFWLGLVPFPFLKVADSLTSRSSLLTPYFFLWLFLSVFGGGDTTRILYNGMPFVFTFLLVRLNGLPTWTCWYVLLTSLPLMRLFTLEPDLGRYPSAMQQWCAECWTPAESWGYWVYAVAVLAGYYYFSRRFGAVGSNETNEVKTHR